LHRFVVSFCVIRQTHRRTDVIQHLRSANGTCSTSLPSQHLRPPCLFSRQPHSLELSPGFHPGSDHQCRVFQTFAYNVFVRSIL